MTVVVLLLLLLSKPDSVSFKSAEMLSGDWRLKLLRWQHRWLVVVLWSLDLDEESLWLSTPQSWSWHGRKVISLLGMEISYGTEMLPWCSLLGPGKKDIEFSKIEILPILCLAVLIITTPYGYLSVRYCTSTMPEISDSKELYNAYNDVLACVNWS